MLSTDLILELKRMSDKINNDAYKFAKIDPNYVSGKPRLMFDMDVSTGALSKPYSYLASYTPVANDRVMVIGGVILGKVMNE
jgi:hypothetical protein